MKERPRWAPRPPRKDAVIAGPIGPRIFVGWVDIEQARYALNVSIAAILALAIAFFFNLQNTYWALLTIPLIVRQQSGTMVWRSAARLAGTLLGALVAMVLVGAFAQSGPAR